jgi:FixJ family two-component response regulator
MDERGIIIADKDAEYRSQVADFFRKAGYQVETTDSAVRVLCSILEKQTPVLLLGSDFDKKIGSADLIHLLKKCNRHLHVIMVSDEMPLALARKVRQEGIFYHALKPATAGDTEEIGQAVACAFEKQGTSALTDPAPAPAQQSQPALCQAAAKIGFSWAQFRKTLPLILGLSALVFGTSYLALAAAETARGGSSLAIWVFLGFCALIVAGQLLPIFRIKLVLGGAEERQVRQPTPRNEK